MHRSMHRIFAPIESNAENIKKLKDKIEMTHRRFYGFQSSDFIPGSEVHEELG